MPRAWAEGRGIRIEYIQPGKPQQNAYIERYNRTVRHEWLDQNIFETIEEAQDQATQWLWTYNNDRPNMAIDGEVLASIPKSKTSLKTENGGAGNASNTTPLPDNLGGMLQRGQ